MKESALLSAVSEFESLKAEEARLLAALRKAESDADFKAQAKLREAWYMAREKAREANDFVVYRISLHRLCKPV